MTDSEKKQTVAVAVAVAMEGRALAWFQFAEDHMGIHGWEGFQQTLLSRFWLEKKGTFCQKFLVVRQETTVEEYLHQYEILVSPLCHLSAAVMEGTFMNRLKPEIQVEVRS